MGAASFLQCRRPTSAILEIAASRCPRSSSARLGGDAVFRGGITIVGSGAPAAAASQIALVS